MAEEKDPNSPATTSATYDMMAPRWDVIETLLGGTPAMREAGEKFLPKHKAETDDDYRARLAGAVLLNMVEQTLDTLSGKPFKEPIKLNEDIPAAIKEPILDDVDLQGNDIHVFARQWFREGFAKAMAHVLVDFPRPQTPANGQPRTLADDRREGLRPYWVLIKPENLIAARAEIVNGREVLQHVRVFETYTEQKGFMEVYKRRIRVLEPGRVEIWEPDPKRRKNGKEVWNKVDEWETGLPVIPLVTFYAHREAFMLGKPPLLDLAWLNITHWQSTAEQRHILRVSRFPILACSGASTDEGEPIVVGPNKVLYNPDPQGKFYYVEHTGASIEAGRNDLKDLEERMAGYGAEFLKKKSGDVTATARALDSAEATSDLASMATIFEDAVAQALDLTAEWMKISGGRGGTVEVLKDFDIEEEDAAGLDALAKARERRDISRKAYLQGLILRGVLPEDFNMEADLEELKDEEDFGAASIDLDPAQKDLPPEPGTEKPPAQNVPPPAE